MQINNFTYNPYVSNTKNLNFEANGKPINLTYIYQNRRYLLPKRVDDAITQILSHGSNKMPSLMELHKELYKPLLTFETLEDAKKYYPEFKNILSDINLQMNSVYAKKHGVKVDSKFVLKLLQEYWAKLRLQDEIAHDLGMSGRSSLNWLLDKIGFVGFDKNYRVLLKASDIEGNKIIAEKTIAWNKANPELRQSLNQHAAQGCKTEEYRAAQRARMYKYDRENPQRREKISKFSKRMWENCSEIKEALMVFAKEQPEYVKRVLTKKTSGQKLNDVEARIQAAFYKRFWLEYPEMKRVMSEAARQAKA